MSSRKCVVCRERVAAVPDRERMGRPIKTVCVECHRARLADDARTIVEAANIANLERAAMRAAKEEKP